MALERVGELSLSQPVTEVPCSDPRIAGLINLRGRIVAALDLGLCVEMEQRIKSPARHMVILEADQGNPSSSPCGAGPVETVVLLCDAVEGIVDDKEGDIQPPPAHARNPWMAGILRVGGNTIGLLSARGLVDGLIDKERNR